VLIPDRNLPGLGGTGTLLRQGDARPTMPFLLIIGRVCQSGRAGMITDQTATLNLGGGTP